MSGGADAGGGASSSSSSSAAVRSPVFEQPDGTNTLAYDPELDTYREDELNSNDFVAAGSSGVFGGTFGGGFYNDDELDEVLFKL